MLKHFFTTGTCTGALEIMMAKGLLAPEPVDRSQQITANHDGKGSLKRRNLLPEPGNHDGKGYLYFRNLYRNPKNHDGKGSL